MSCQFKLKSLFLPFPPKIQALSKESPPKRQMEKWFKILPGEDGQVAEATFKLPEELVGTLELKGLTWWNQLIREYGD